MWLQDIKAFQGVRLQLAEHRTHTMGVRKAQALRCSGSPGVHTGATVEKLHLADQDIASTVASAPNLGGVCLLIACSRDKEQRLLAYAAWNTMCSIEMAK